MSENNIRKCKVCEKEVSRILKGKYPDGKNKKWVDERGKEWSGRKCPTCHVNDAKNVMRKNRSV